MAAICSGECWSFNEFLLLSLRSLLRAESYIACRTKSIHCLLTGLESNKHSVILAKNAVSVALSLKYLKNAFIPCLNYETKAIFQSKHQSLGSDNNAWAKSGISILKAIVQHLSTEASVSARFLDHVKSIRSTGLSLVRCDGLCSSQLDSCEVRRQGLRDDVLIVQRKPGKTMFLDWKLPGRCVTAFKASRW